MMPSIRRLALILVASLAIAAQPVVAEPEASTGVTISVVPEGTFDVAWVGDAPVFLVNGSAPAPTAADPEVNATATFTLAISDTRPDESRPGYTLAISAMPFASDRGTIEPERLTIVDLTGLPDGLSAATAVGRTLETPVVIVVAPGGTPAVSATLTITVAMRIGPGIPAGEYSGGVAFEIQSYVTP